MGGTDGGAFRRMLRKLTSDVGELDADDLSEHAERPGRSGPRNVPAVRRSRCSVGYAASSTARRTPTATLEAELFDGTEGVTLSGWAAAASRASSRAGPCGCGGGSRVRDGRKVLYNPYYEICQANTT